MIPLSPSEKVKTFPGAILFVVFFLLVFNISFFVGNKNFGESLQLWVDQSFLRIWWPFLLAPFYPHVFSMLINLWFFWVFAPKVFEKSRWYFLIPLLFATLFIVGNLFIIIYPSSPYPLMSEAWLGLFFGVYLRHGIWSTMTTLVPGPGWLRVYEVPSYVLLFFWVFYSLLSNLFLPDPFSFVPMPYFLSLSSLLIGFLAESARLALFKATKTRHN